MTKGTKVVRKEGKICFSMHPLPMCAKGCYATKTKTVEEPFYCEPLSPATEHYLKLVKKGINPDFSRKPINPVYIPVIIPVHCVPNE